MLARAIVKSNFQAAFFIDWYPVGAVYQQMRGYILHLLTHCLSTDNYYAGFGPATVEMFLDLWRRQTATETGKRNRVEQEQLFK